MLNLALVFIGRINFKSVVAIASSAVKPEYNILPDLTVEELLRFGIDLLTVGVGVAAVGGVVYGSILYITAGGSSDKTKSGMEIIKNTIIGIIVYAVFYVILDFLIPEGVPK